MTNLIHPQNYNLDEVNQLMNLCDVEEYGEPDSSMEDLEELWNEIDLTQDAWITRDDQGNLSGYASVVERTTSYIQEIYILSNRSPLNLEFELMKACEDRVKQCLESQPNMEKSVISGYATSVNQRIQEAYIKSGFIVHNHHYRMQIDFTEPYELPPWPEKYRLDPFKEEDEQGLYHLIESTFDWTGHKMASIESWRGALFRGGRYEPDLFVMLRDGQKLIGAALSYFENHSGWIRQLAVHKEYQGEGLGALLLKHMFGVYSLRKASGVGLAVSSMNEKAYRFYERNGMYRSREFLEYRKLLK